MRLQGGLQHDANLSRLDLTAPRYFRRLPGGAKAIDLTAFNREPRLGAALVTFDHVERQAERGFEQLGHIGQACARSDGRYFYRSFRSKPVVDASDSALTIKVTRGVVRTWDPDPAYFAAVKLRGFVAHHVL